MKKSLASVLFIFLCFVIAGNALALGTSSTPNLSVPKLSDEMITKQLTTEKIAYIKSDINMIKSIFPEAEIDIDEYLNYQAVLTTTLPQEKMELHKKILAAGPVQKFDKVFPDGSKIQLTVYINSVYEYCGVTLASPTYSSGWYYYTGSTVYANNVQGISGLNISYKVDHSLDSYGSGYASSAHSARNTIVWDHVVCYEIRPKQFNNVPSSVVSLRAEKGYTLEVFGVFTLEYNCDLIFNANTCSATFNYPVW